MNCSRTIFILLGVAALVALASRRVSFRGHKVLDITISSQSEIDFLRGLPEHTDGVTGLDVWSNDGILLTGLNRVRATPQGFAAIEARGMNYVVVHQDLQARLDEVNGLDAKHMPNVGLSASDPKDNWYYKWHSYAEIVSKLSEITQENKDFVEFFPAISQTEEGRNISGIRLGHHEGVTRTVVFQAGTHAREWISEAVVMWATALILENKDLLPVDTELIVVPCYNPDGYSYSISNNRYWRKNRHKNHDGTYGVDQNRNWDVNWSGEGASKSTSSDIYCGTAPFSEIETATISKWVLGLSSNVSAVIDFHSHACLILRPWAYTDKAIPSEDEKRMKGFTQQMAQLIKSVHGTGYDPIAGHELYVASGTAGDWYYKAGLKTSYVIELAGDDFVVPESDIQKQGEEMWPALLDFVVHA